MAEDAGRRRCYARAPMDGLLSGLCQHDWTPAERGAAVCPLCGLEIKLTVEMVDAWMAGELDSLATETVDPDEVAAALRLYLGW